MLTTFMDATMKRTEFFLLQSIFASLFLTLISIESYAQVEVQDAQTVLLANTLFDEAMDGENRPAIDALLDSEFSWYFPTAATTVVQMRWSRYQKQH